MNLMRYVDRELEMGRVVRMVLIPAHEFSTFQLLCVSYTQHCLYIIGLRFVALGRNKADRNNIRIILFFRFVLLSALIIPAQHLD